MISDSTFAAINKALTNKQREEWNEFKINLYNDLDYIRDRQHSVNQGKFIIDQVQGIRIKRVIKAVCTLPTFLEEEETTPFMGSWNKIPHPFKAESIKQPKAGSSLASFPCPSFTREGNKCVFGNKCTEGLKCKERACDIRLPLCDAANSQPLTFNDLF